MKLVVDTSILIDILRTEKTWDELIGKIKEQNAEIFIPTIVIFELYTGKSSINPIIKNIISNLIRNFRRIELTEVIARHAGELYRDIGKHIDAEDYIIAASALEIGGTVLTLNTKHFRQIPNLTIYPL